MQNYMYLYVFHLTSSPLPPTLFPPPHKQPLHLNLTPLPPQKDT